MKKIVTVIAALMIMGSVSFAQDATKTTTSTKTTAKSTMHVKKDGTPDKRFKENKTKKTTTTTKATTK